MVKGFGPVVPGFDHVPLGDLAAVENAIRPETAAVLIEPIQGEGGIRVMPPADLRALRALCDRHGLLLVLDEIQCGMGRTGRLFYHEWAGITPDIMTVAKGIGGGFPLGACLATEAAAAGMVTGTHGSTYGGNPLACAVGIAVMDIVTAPGFLDHVSRVGGRLRQGLEGLVAAHPAVFEAVRGEGLMLGLKCRMPVGRGGEGGLRRAGAGGAGGGERGAAPAGAEPDRGRGGRGAAPARRGGGGARGGGVRHFLDLHATPAAELRGILGAAAAMKAARAGKPRGAPDAEPALAGRVVALVFEKPSTRTRVSFDVGVRQLGGETLVLSGGEMQLGHGETIADTARVLSRYVDLIMIRTFDPAVLQRAGRVLLGAGDQRADRRQPSLPDHGRRDDLRGAPRADRGGAGGLVGGRQQRLRLVPARGGTVRLRPGLHRAGGLRPGAGGGGLRARDGGRRWRSSATR